MPCCYDYCCFYLLPWLLRDSKHTRGCCGGLVLEQGALRPMLGTVLVEDPCVLGVRNDAHALGCLVPHAAGNIMFRRRVGGGATTFVCCTEVNMCHDVSVFNIATLFILKS